MRLTEREDHVMRMLAKGLTTKQVARELELSMHTVIDHRKAILRKLEAPNMIAAVCKWKDMVCA